jgi:alpha-ketoglutarate-dependent taurine dioxygenase
VNVRLYTTAAAANPHNDPSDCVGLLCVRHAREGGRSMIASATSIYNRVVNEHPEYLPILHRGFPHDLRGEGVTASLNETTPDIPVFSDFGGKISCCLNSKSSRTARDKQGRPMTGTELAAIKYIEDLAESPELCLGMDFRPGDIQFLNNYTIIHTRTAFRDDPDPDRRRLLLRLWLNLHEGRPLAPGFGDRFNNGSRGGVPAVKP